MIWARKVRVALLLLGSFVWDIFASTWEVARIVLAPGVRTEPAIVEMPVSLTRPWAVAMLAYFTSLTPGSTCLHVSEDRTMLYLHIIDVQDPDLVIAKYQRIYESRIAELER